MSSDPMYVRTMRYVRMIVMECVYVVTTGIKMDVRYIYLKYIQDTWVPSFKIYLNAETIYNCCHDLSLW